MMQPFAAQTASTHHSPLRFSLWMRIDLEEQLSDQKPLMSPFEVMPNKFDGPLHPKIVQFLFAFALCTGAQLRALTNGFQRIVQNENSGQTRKWRPVLG